MITFSFHPVKHITTGEGSMILTNNEEYYKKLLLFYSHGITRDKDLMSKKDGDWYYEQLTLGYNYRITNIQCALGVTQMRKLEQFITRRKELVNRYNNAFEHVNEIVVPFQHHRCNRSWHLYVIQVKERKKMFDFLRNAGIGVDVHYIPVYLHLYYQEIGYRKTRCVNAERLYKHIISLPLYPELTNAEQDYVIEQVLHAIKTYKIQ